jgi:hypothetical protein
MVSAGGPASAAVAPNPVGTHNHMYVGGNTASSLTLNADHTLTSAVGGGHWTAAGKSIALTFDLGEVMAGKITAKGLNSLKTPGTGYQWITNGTTTWYATWS